MRKPKPPQPAKEEKARRQKLDAVASAMSAFKPAREVLELIKSVPTCMVQFDHAIRTGGWPIEVVSVCSGASNEGKTAFALLLIKSFLDRGHFALHVDAERTTPFDWVRTMVGPKAEDTDFFKAIRPDTYEQTVDEVRSFYKAVKALRDGKHIPQDTTAIAVVDSLQKLTPKDFYRQATKHDHVDPMKGMGPAIKAKHNAAWFHELTPLTDNTGTGFFAISREYEDRHADAWSRGMGTNVVVAGGKSVILDASIYVRISRAAWITERKKGEDDDEKGLGAVFGEKHCITIKKTKVGGKEGRASLAYFHTSNGELVPAGHDRARDVLDLARRFEIVEASGSWLSWGKRKLGQGEHRSVVNLTEDPGMLAELEAKVRVAFATVEPIVVDEKTGELV